MEEKRKRDLANGIERVYKGEDKERVHRSKQRDGTANGHSGHLLKPGSSKKHQDLTLKGKWKLFLTKLQRKEKINAFAQNLKFKFKKKPRLLK